MKDSADLLDRIARFLERRPSGAASTEIALRVLRVADPSPRTAGRVVDSLLEKDPRFRRLGVQFWAFAPPEPFVEKALLYGACRASLSDPRLHRIALLRVEAGEEKGSATFDRRAGSAAPLPESARPLAANARLVLFSRAAPFAVRRDDGHPLLTEPEPLRIRRRLAPHLPATDLRSPERLAARLGLDWRESEDPLDEARLLHRIVEETAAWLAGGGERGPAGGEIPFLREGGWEELERIPDSPGVYRLSDGGGHLLYVGKSRSLRARVESYFSGYGNLSERKRAMVRRVTRVDAIPLGSEAEALVEEWRAIRRRRPPYNEKIEVRSEPSADLDGRNRVLFLPAADPKRVTLFLFRNDGAVRRLSARRNPIRTARLGDALLSFFGGRGGGRDEGARALLGRWIRENRERITLLDADRYAGAEDLLRVVVECLRDPELTSGTGSERI
ncbi:MAG: nucleotide excision repair endonuclease [Candidatus Eisenbacteria bacterium]|nr:nucleotide excision repair endonuclease [Candidatus Eisenbacteria bacterium]